MCVCGHSRLLYVLLIQIPFSVFFQDDSQELPSTTAVIGNKKQGTSAASLLLPSSPDLLSALETYDFPRSVNPVPVPASIVSGSSSSRSTLCATTPSTSQASLPTAKYQELQTESSEQEHLYANGNLVEDDDEPLYENEGVISSDIVPEFEKNQQQQQNNSALDLYDVPRNEQPIILGQSLTRLRRYGSSVDELSVNQRNISQSEKYLQRGRSVSSLALGGGVGVQLRRPPKGQGGSATQLVGGRSNRSSVQSESAESGIVMASGGAGVHNNSHHHQTAHNRALSGGGVGRNRGQQDASDLYDVPRGTGQTNGIGGVRPTSALSIGSSGMGLSIATSDSKDSLDGLYDVPRNSSSSSSGISVKTYVNHMEAKYEDVRRQRHDSQGSSGSGRSAGAARPVTSHTRHNSTSSIFSAYGYRSAGKGEGLGGSNGQLEDMYDVPRGSCAHPLSQQQAPPRPPSRANTINSSSNGSLNGDGDPMQFYDVPSQFARKVTVSNSSLASSTTSASGQYRGSSNGYNNHHHHTNNSTNGESRKLEAETDIKLLPLGAKAAVSVCEKLRQEIVSSITSILANVKPKWRSKENLTEIMPDLKFSCTRLCLAIKVRRSIACGS